MKTKIYPFKWDLFNLISTPCVLGLTLFSVFIVLVASPTPDIIVFFSVIWIFLIVFFLISPTRLEIDDQSIAIKHVIGRTVIPFGSIESTQKMEKWAMMKSIRIFGSAGYFGYTGIFYSSTLKSYHCYAKRMNSLLLVRTDRRTYMIECSAPDEVIHLIEQYSKKQS